MLNSNLPLNEDFPRSGRGLWVLFSIGVFYQVVGVTFSDASIVIPWFPKVTLQRPQYIIGLYFVVLFYSLYRYRLHNQVLFLNFRSEALEWSLKNTKIGSWFIRRFIFDENCGHFFVTNTPCQITDSDGTALVRIESDYYSIDDEQDIGGFAASFSIGFGVDQDLSVYFREQIATGHHYEAIDKASTSWKLVQVDRYDHRSQGIIALKLRALIYVMIFRGALSVVGRGVCNFDQILPFFANVCLVLYIFLKNLLLN